MPGVIVEGQSAVKTRKPTKNEQRRAKKKQQKLETDNKGENGLADTETAPLHPDANHPAQPAEPPRSDPIPAVPVIAPEVESLEDNPLFAQYASVVAKFQQTEEDDLASTAPEIKPEVFYDDDDNVQDEDEEEETTKRLSKKARKAATKLSIAELKAIVRKPEVVDWTDVSAHDPRLLVNIKSTRNVVPVPSHWNLKREYLSSKRGIEKPPWTLPKFIADTGIAEMRQAVLDKQEEATLKQKQRERVSGKTGTLNIDYGKVYDAFFRFQTKPVLTTFGEVYYEGKEYETNLRHLQPGQYSDALKEALNMGPVQPPPWLLTQQKIGPPPSYPALKIPGVNAPIPLGAQWGFQPGGYGKPPTNDQGVAIWGGDLFGTSDADTEAEAAKEKEHEAMLLKPAEKTLWGELQPLDDVEEEEEEEEDEDEEGADGEDADAGASAHAAATEARTDAAGITSTIPTELISGLHTNPTGDLHLRKSRFGTETESTSAAAAPPRSAGQVLQQRNIRAEGFFGGDHTYDLDRAAPLLDDVHASGGRKRKAADVDVSVDVDAIERGDRLSRDQLQQQYNAQRAQESSGTWRDGAPQEDYSDMVADDAAKRQKREKERARDRGRGGGGGGGGRR